MTELRAGVNGVSFRSDRETLIGKPYLPSDCLPGMKLPRGGRGRLAHLDPW